MEQTKIAEEHWTNVLRIRTARHYQCRQNSTVKAKETSPKKNVHINQFISGVLELEHVHGDPPPREDEGPLSGGGDVHGCGQRRRRVHQRRGLVLAPPAEQLQQQPVRLGKRKGGGGEVIISGERSKDSSALQSTPPLLFVPWANWPWDESGDSVLLNYARKSRYKSHPTFTFAVAKVLKQLSGRPASCSSSWLCSSCATCRGWCSTLRSARPSAPTRRPPPGDATRCRCGYSSQTPGEGEIGRECHALFGFFTSSLVCR